MVDQFTEVNKLRVVEGRITYPRSGTWVMDASFAGPDPLDGDPMACRVVLGNLVLTGTVARQADFAGKLTARLVGGANGWQNVIPAKSYSLNGGVMASTVLADAARLAKEKIVVATDVNLGPAWTRKQGPAEYQLRRIFKRTWWIDPSGTTQTKPLDGSIIVGPFQIIQYHGLRGLFEIATEDYASWLPGRTFSAPTIDNGPQTISSTSFVIKDGKTRLEVLNTTTQSERLLSQIRAIVREEMALATEYGVMVSYVITQSASMLISCNPENPASGWPPLQNVTLKAGLFGETVTPTVGAKCIIFFLNGDPSAYRCIGIDGITQTTNFGASGNIVASPGGIFQVASGSDFCALAQKTKANDDAMVTWATSHTHGTGVGPSTPPLAPPNPANPVACTKTKTD